jgi:formate hydrogenlyase subunit 3/multisubunit Na+/H+ antiporter MnhD subunit
MSAAGWTLFLVPAWPAALALAGLALRRREALGLLAIAGPLPAVYAGFALPGPVAVFYPWLFLGTRLGLTSADGLFLLCAGLVWLVSAGFAHAWIRGPGRARFFVFFMLGMSGNLGALVAQDLPGFYVGFALMSFAAYGLVVHADDERARHAARVYIVLVLVGEAALALAMMFAAGAVGATDFDAVRTGVANLPWRDLVIGFAVLGFGIKAGAPILHVWLPLAHPVAPAPASAVLSGAMIATGLVGWLRFLPLGELASPAWGGGLVIAGLAAAFYGAFVGLDQREPKVVLAYSSVSQMGIMTAGVGSIFLAPALAAPLGVAVAFFALHHGLAKSALFLGAGLAKTAASAPVRRALLAGLALPSLALAGAPLTSGMLAKGALVAGDGALPAAWATALGVALPLSSIATALLMTRFLALLRSAPGAAAAKAGRVAWLAWGLSLALAIGLPWWSRPAATAAAGFGQIVASAWPLGAAAVLAVSAVWLWRRAGRPTVPPVPIGDVLLPMEKFFATAGRGLSRLTARAGAARRTGAAVAATLRRRAWRWIEKTQRAESFLNGWQVALTLAVAFGAALALLAWR